MSRQLSGRAVRFAATGVGVTAVHASVAVVLIERFLADVVLANGFAFAVATTVSFLVNTLWSFPGESGDFFTQQSPVLGSPHPMPPYVA